MELLGVRVAYHIRLSKELGDKRFVPIVVISDFDAEQLNRFDALSAILFTKNISLIKNTKEEIGKFQSIYIQNLTQEEYGSEFLSKIKVEAPKDYLSHHDISNEWAIYRWGEFLKVDGKAIDKNKQKIESMLYFKYLKSKYSFQDREDFKINRPSKGGKVLLIDDEWKKGWSDILHTALSSQDLELKTFEYNYKDKSEFNLIVQLNYKELKEQIQNTDVVILDLRLTENDHNNGDIDNYTGVKILQRIHEINAGIQVIMLTATSKSTVLEKLYEYKILGYIKKEHPEDHSISTVENINKLIYLVDKGLNRKFLKNIYVTKIKILEILEYDIIAQYGIELERYEPFCLKLQVEIESIFDILDGNSQNRFLYAMVSIASSLEAILSIFINDREMTFWDKEPYNCEHNALWCRIDKLFNKIGSIKQFNTRELIQKRNSYLHRKPVTVNEKEITSWFEMLNKMIEIIQNPKN